jgi:hypothetical protein
MSRRANCEIAARVRDRYLKRSNKDLEVARNMSLAVSIWVGQSSSGMYKFIPINTRTLELDCVAGWIMAPIGIFHNTRS